MFRRLFQQRRRRFGEDTPQVSSKQQATTKVVVVQGGDRNCNNTNKTSSWMKQPEKQQQQQQRRKSRVPSFIMFSPFRSPNNNSSIKMRPERSSFHNSFGGTDRTYDGIHGSSLSFNMTTMTDDDMIDEMKYQQCKRHATQQRLNTPTIRDILGLP